MNPRLFSFILVEATHIGVYSPATVVGGYGMLIEGDLTREEFLTALIIPL